MHLNFLIIPLSIIVLFIAGCSDHDDEYVPPPATLSNIQLTIDSSQFPIGINHTAVAIGYYTDGHTESGISYAWRSESPGVATVDDAGLVTGVSIGSTKIFVDEQGKESYILITITDAVPQSIQILPGYNSVANGLTVQYQALALYSDQEHYDITNYSNLSWESSDVDVVSFIGTDGIAHTATSGEVTIDVFFEGLSALEPAALKVTNAVLTELVITPFDTNIVPVGQTVRFIATAYYDNDTSSDVSGTAEWAPESTPIIDLTHPGYFYGKSIGTTEISSTYKSKSSTKIVEVIAPEFESLTIYSQWGYYPELTSVQFTANAYFVGGLVYDITNQKNVYWQSSDIDIATIALNGVVSMVSPGFVDISYTFNDVTKTKNIEVTQAKLNLISIEPKEQYFVGEGHKRKISVTGHYDNDITLDLTNNNDLTWELENDTDKSKGHVSQQGEVFNYPTTDPISRLFNFSVSLDGISAYSLANFGATKVLSNTERTLSFIGPFSDVDAVQLDFTDYGVLQVEDGIKGNQGTTFITMSLVQATWFCDALTYDGFDNYRLPTYNELQVLWTKYDNENDDIYKLYTEKKWAISQPFWSTTFVDDTVNNYRKLVNLSNGEEGLSADPTTAHYATCVRDVN